MLKKKVLVVVLMVAVFVVMSMKIVPENHPTFDWDLLVLTKVFVLIYYYSY